MIRIGLTLVCILHVCYSAFGQVANVSEMQWDDDSYLYVTLSNDSSIKMNVNTLHHSSIGDSSGNGNDFTYYPVTFSPEFVSRLQGKEVEYTDSVNMHSKDETLWSAINYTLGGGWVHFVNSLLYALETQKLTLTAPLMTRPDSDWKPKPMTDSYKRTRKWDYYVPVDQKYAQKEYQSRKSKGELDNLNGVPGEFIELFIETSRKEYEALKQAGEYKTVAKIDLVKLLLGSNYLGQAQIDYIKTMVLKAVQLYTSRLPSVIILDDYAAAVVMTLDETGYHVEKIEFRDRDHISEQEIEMRKELINGVINKINEVNKGFLKDQLKSYYNN